jgi:hypothetical protein
MELLKKGGMFSYKPAITTDNYQEVNKKVMKNYSVHALESLWAVCVWCLLGGKVANCCEI